ncbi:hypothetical protein DFQ28_002600 [Apophysomyces sp. BC1034]|nr:hypothetical protein DFQ30_002993 [Apophysomyces sp. BC1015]KAG0179611.1 hypothetical protein DFQ29_001868 [Apophysomyces sp. BC1021]KAG0190025.1 hypothetical protein DFQ28_002600 [Apophysomyces sp. BC1034]
MTNLVTIQAQYQKALRYFVLTKYSQAATTCTKAILTLSTSQEMTMEFVELQTALWLLYLNVATIMAITQKSLFRVAKLFGILPCESKEQFCHALWINLLEKGYTNDAGLVDPQLVSAFMVMSLKLDVPAVGRQAIEQWYACLSDATLDHLGSVQEEPSAVMEAYLKTVEIYVTRILPAMNDFESSKSFLQYNTLVPEDKRETLQRMVQAKYEATVQEQQRKDERQKAAKEAAEAAARTAKIAAEKKELERQRRENEAKDIEAASAATAEASAQNSSNTSPQPEKSRISPSPSISSTRSIPVEKSRGMIRQTRADKSLVILKNWIQQLSVNGSAVYAAILVILFALLGILRSHKSYLSLAVKGFVSKIWQTVQMGTKVTYM